MEPCGTPQQREQGDEQASSSTIFWDLSAKKETNQRKMVPPIPNSTKKDTMVDDAEDYWEVQQEQGCTPPVHSPTYVIHQGDQGSFCSKPQSEAKLKRIQIISFIPNPSTRTQFSCLHHVLGPNRIQLSSTDAAPMHTWGKGTNVPLTWGGLCDCPSATGSSTCHPTCHKCIRSGKLDRLWHLVYHWWWLCWYLNDI